MRESQEVKASSSVGIIASPRSPVRVFAFLKHVLIFKCQEVS